MDFFNLPLHSWFSLYKRDLPWRDTIDPYKIWLSEIILQQKGKYGFPSPIDHALKTNPEGKQLFFDFYGETPLLKKKETAALGDAFYHGSGDVSIFWRTLSYILWYQIFFKGWKKFTV